MTAICGGDEVRLLVRHGVVTTPRDVCMCGWKQSVIQAHARICQHDVCVEPEHPVVVEQVFPHRKHRSPLRLTSSHLLGIHDVGACIHVRVPVASTPFFPRRTRYVSDGLVLAVPCHVCDDGNASLCTPLSFHFEVFFSRRRERSLCPWIPHRAWARPSPPSAHGVHLPKGEAEDDKRAHEKQGRFFRTPCLSAARHFRSIVVRDWGYRTLQSLTKRRRREPVLSHSHSRRVCGFR